MTSKKNPPTNIMSVEDKTKNNIWDHFVTDVLPTLKAASTGKWNWMNNGLCKYIDLRIDMRTGHCILSNRNGTRINPEDFRHQAINSTGLPWPGLVSEASSKSIRMTQEQISALSHELVMQTERAIAQRDEFFRTGNSTAANGGSHDTCFEFIIKRFIEKENGKIP